MKLYRIEYRVNGFDYSKICEGETILNAIGNFYLQFGYYDILKISYVNESQD